MKSVKLSKKCCVLKLSDKQERSTLPSSSQKSAPDYLGIRTLDSSIANLPACIRLQSLPNTLNPVGTRIWPNLPDRHGSSLSTMLHKVRKATGEEHARTSWFAPGPLAFCCLYAYGSLGLSASTVASDCAGSFRKNSCQLLWVMYVLNSWQTELLCLL